MRPLNGEGKGSREGEKPSNPEDEWICGFQSMDPELKSTGGGRRHPSLGSFCLPRWLFTMVQGNGEG